MSWLVPTKYGTQSNCPLANILSWPKLSIDLFISLDLDQDCTTQIVLKIYTWWIHQAQYQRKEKLQHDTVPQVASCHVESMSFSVSLLRVRLQRSAEYRLTIDWKSSKRCTERFCLNWTTTYWRIANHNQLHHASIYVPQRGLFGSHPGFWLDLAVSLTHLLDRKAEIDPSEAKHMY